ncbi:UvrD-helicase domain-containing protein [Jatrophihabitans sp. YIM 134969]
MSGEAFDLLGPLPTGTTVLEASAGTGKTFTIAGLVTRLVAEGVTPLEQLLVVTFGRAATQELRERVRERLVTARDALADPAAARAATGDTLAAYLATGAAADVAERHHRLVESCARYDSATVVTTHGFCEQVLRSLGTAGDVDDDVVLVEDLDDLTVEVVEDFYVRKWGVPNAPPPVITLAEALELARRVVGDPSAALVPDASDDDTARTRYAFARGVREEVERRKRQRRVIGFDDLLTRLQTTLADPRTGPPAKARLRQRFSTVLVDEFQDTDPVQWDILRTAFHGRATLVLVGDPKQAIYAFRGADVYAYLEAEATAGERRTLDHNWRSDPDVLRGLAGVFRGAALGDPRIVVSDVAAGRAGRSLAVGGAPVRLRLLRSGAETAVGPLRELVTADLVAEVVALLDSRASLTPRGRGQARPVRPGDLAVIVRTGAQLDLVHDALREAGVPAVRRATSSVFRSSAARDWVVLLEALEQPHRPARLRRLAVSSFVGWDAAALLDRPAVDALGEQLRRWIQVHAERGVAALFETVSRDRSLAARLLAQVDGERDFTDLRHISEVLHAASMAEQLGLTAGLEWLRHHVEESGTDSAVERSRRLDSDAAAVQCVTIHSSKGLEFPVVYVPFGWDRFVPDREDIPLFHDDAGRRVRDVGGFRHRGFPDSLRRHRAEEFGEDLRLTYVAMTRAQAQVTAWWAPSRKNTPYAPLHRLLFCPDPAVGPPEQVTVPNDTAAFTAASTLAVEGALSVVQVEPRPAARWQPPGDTTQALELARLGRGLDTAWRRTSYTSLTAAVHDSRPAIGSEPEFPEKDDEPETPAPSEATTSDLRDVPSPWADLPGGAAFGTTVHAALEELDTEAADLDAEVRTRVGAALARHGVGAIDAEVLAAALATAVRTPLGPLLDGRSLARIAPADRLAELEFELPLGGGERPRRSSTLRDLARVWRDHVGPEDPLRRYAELLADPVLGAADLRGYLTGSIDAVLRVNGRYVVVDYKTNRLGVPEVPLTAWDYRPDAMADAMVQAHYPLQALLYEVALHRFLRWRVADYDPEVHLGGVAYLFLRGMTGEGVVFDDGSVPGVFDWRPPAGLVVAASDVLAGAAG